MKIEKKNRQSAAITKSGFSKNININKNKEKLTK